MGVCKALVEWEGETCVGRLVRRLVEAGCTPVVVVTGAFDFEPPAPAVRAHAHAWSLGMRESLRVGLRAVPDDRPCLVTHVDRPGVAAGTLRAVREVGPSPAACIVPHYLGEPGHPVRISPTARRRLLEPDEQSLREVLASLPEVSRLDVDDPAVLQNLNTPADLRPGGRSGR
jgi:nicotine blue oxidoreductase